MAKRINISCETSLGALLEKQICQFSVFVPQTLQVDFRIFKVKTIFTHYKNLPIISFELDIAFHETFAQKSCEQLIQM